MSDQSPPPKPKPGSLRDRIAAFENKGASTPPLGPPQPRPKPSNLQWKPKPPSPPTTPGIAQSVEHKPPSTGGMSASDAMESIGRAGSLKERMAALQGKGGFGGPPPPIAPKPNVERPKWKSPPAVPAHVASDDDESQQGIPAGDAGGREASRSPPPRAAVSPPPESQGAANREEDVGQEGDSGDQDPEEQERQRRAAIAARMARLGGARLGMGPPVFSPKPVTRKAESVPPTHEAKGDTPADQSTMPKESSEVSITSPLHDLPVSGSLVSDVVAETEHSNETDPSPPVPTRAPISMPVPTGPRRAAPPRKKAGKNAPTAPLPEPPAEDIQSMSAQSCDLAEAGRVIRDEPLTISDAQKGTGEGLETVQTTSEEHPDVPVGAEELPTSVPAFHEQTEESEQQGTEEPVEGVATYVEGEPMGAVADDQEVPSPSEQPSEAVDPQEDEEARHHRIAARLAQMGAFNPLSGPPPIPQRSSLDEPTQASFDGSLDVEEVNVDKEKYGETIPSPLPTVPSRPGVGQSIQRDHAESHLEGQNGTKLDVDTQAPADRDGDHVAASYLEGQGDRDDGHTSPPPEFSEEQPIEHGLFSPSATAPTQQAGAFESPSPLQTEEQDTKKCELHADYGTIVHCTTAKKGDDTCKDDVEEDEMPPPRITRPIPPPPVNLRSKPTPPASPPLSPPPRTSSQALRVDEEERPPASPDMPPRPIPPPGRRSSLMEDVPSPAPRRSIPPPRRMSGRMTEPVMDTPSSSPPVPTSPRPINRKPPTPPPIITTLVTPEPATSDEHEKEEPGTGEEASEDVTPQPDEQEDEASSRRLAIAERMARLGGIRFGAAPLMNPLSRPPLPAAPPPTSIPPDDAEVDEDEDGPREDEEEDEVARKQRIAAKLAGMGGMRIGMLPPGVGLPPATVRRVVSKQEESENEDGVPPVPVPAPAQRLPPTRKPPPIVQVTVGQESELVSEGSHGTSDDGVKVEAEESEMEEVHYSDAEILVASEEEGAPALPPPRRSSQTPRAAEVLPTPPPRMTSRSPPPGRPPIPTIPTSLLGRQASATTARSVSVASSRMSTDDSSPSETPTVAGRGSESAVRPSSEYVMVEAEEPDSDTSLTPAPRRRPTRGAPPLPPVPPPSAIDPPASNWLTSNAQWELPSIPQGNEFADAEIASSGWSEDSTVVHTSAQVSTSPPGSRPESRRASGKVLTSSGSGFGSGTIGSGSAGSVGSGRRSVDQQPPLTTDTLMAIWGKVGVQVVDVATTLFEKSKRALVGDGSYAGFVRAVLTQVPGVTVPVDGEEWGHVVYAQTGGAVQRRVSDIMPGDVVAFWDAKFKGHKGLHTYTQTAGAGAESGGGAEPLVGIVSEFDGKKSKVRVWQANQRVGQQTVENVSYRLDDMKSGQAKVYRVLDA